MALTLSVTDAGRAALRNPTGNGTNAVRIATVGVTSTAFVSGQPVTGEIKRIATIAGGATSPDTIHVTVSDNGGDIYSVRGFGFYLDDGTLFASFSQANVIVEKSAQATMMMAVDVKFTDIDATQITFGDSNFSNPAATTDTLGVVRLALEAEAIAGVDAQKAVTSKALLAALNDRLGAGAPTAFIKTLLTKANVLAFCTALGIRGAAQYDPGSGNGLDADLLDGKDGPYYLQWANLTGVPVYATRWPSYAEVTGKPDSFAIGYIAGLQAALDGKLNLTGGTMSGGIDQAKGAVGSQQVFRGYGWTNGVMRWRTVMETDGKWSLYSYDATGNTAEQALMVSSGSTGGRDLRFYGNTVWNAANFDPNSKAPTANPSFTGLMYVTVNNGSTAKARIFPYGTNGVAIESVTADASSYAPIALTGTNVVITAAGGNKVTINGSVVQSGGWSGPGQGVATMSYQANGSYGGGYAIVDGSYNIGLYSVGGVLNFGFGTNGGALSSKLQLGADGGLQTWAQVTANGSAFRASGWGGIATDGVYYFGNASSYIYKSAGQFMFNNEQGGFSAALASGGTIWTSASITPLDKNVGGYMGAPIYFNGSGSGNGIYPGNGDNAGFSANNLALKSWNGIGFGPSISGQPVAAGAYSHYFDVRAGHMGIAGDLRANGTLYANGGFQYSDREIKKAIAPRAVQRGIAYAMAMKFAQWTRKADDVHDVGMVAQDLEEIAPHHVRRGPKRRFKPGLLVVDKAGAALEASMDNALAIHEQAALITALQARIEQLENAA